MGFSTPSLAASRDDFLDERGVVGADLDRLTGGREQLLVRVDPEQVVQRAAVTGRLES
jgi:hypothetical protein